MFNVCVVNKYKNKAEYSHPAAARLGRALYIKVRNHQWRMLEATDTKLSGLCVH